MARKTLSALALGLALLSGPAWSADSFKFDFNHSEIGFNVTHLGLMKVHGTFDKFEGSLQIDEKDMSKSSVEVSIDPASVNTRVGYRDNDLRSESFFYVEKFPKATFKSTKVEAGKDGSFKVTGDLTLRGVTKSVVLDGRSMGRMVDDKGNTHLGFQASTTINRFDYGIAWNKKTKTGILTAGAEVEIVLQVEAVLAK